VLAVTTTGVLRLRVPDLPAIQRPAAADTEQAIASNSTAALAFDNADDAAVVLSASELTRTSSLRPCTMRKARLSQRNPQGLAAARVPARPGAPGYTFGRTELTGFQPVAEGSRQLGHAVRRIGPRRHVCAHQALRGDRLLVIGISFPLGLLISRRLQHQLLQSIHGARRDDPGGIGAPRLHRPRGPDRRCTNSTCFTDNLQSTCSRRFSSPKASCTRPTQPPQPSAALSRAQPANARTCRASFRWCSAASR